MYFVVSLNFTISESKMSVEQALHRKNAWGYTPKNSSMDTSFHGYNPIHPSRYESIIPAFLLFFFTLHLRLYRASAETMKKVFHSFLGVICASEGRYAEPYLANVFTNL